MQQFKTCLWYDDQAEEAIDHYKSIFKDFAVGAVSRHPDGPMAGKVLAIEFSIQGHSFLALNGGPLFNFTEAVSFMVECRDQAEIDHYWDRLSEGGDPKAQQCGWLKDKFGVSWQVVPVQMGQWFSSGDAEAAKRVTAAFMPMQKLDLATLQKAYDNRA